MPSTDSNITNSEVIATTLSNMIEIYTRKSVKIHAVHVLNQIKKQLEMIYPFLAYIEIKDKSDTLHTENFHTININPAFDQEPDERIGSALHNLINGFSQTIGKNDTYFLLNELQTKLPSTHISKLGAMGVDFELIQLEREVEFLEL